MKCSYAHKQHRNIALLVELFGSNWIQAY